MTDAEAAALQEEFFNQFLPEGWYFDGYSYNTKDGYRTEAKHPNLELLI